MRRVAILVLLLVMAACGRDRPGSTNDYDGSDLDGSLPTDTMDADGLPEDPPPPPPPPPPVDSASDAVRAVDAALAQLDLGHVAFNAPERVNVAESVTVVLALSPDQAMEEVAARITGPGEHIVQSVQVSHLMEARLTGAGFDIVAVTPMRQAVGTGITEWAWDVTPEAEGERTLTLALDALIKVDGETVPRSLRTFRHPIAVEVTTGQRVGAWLSEHGKWAWSALLLPGLLWWNKRRRAAKESSEPPPTP